MKEATNRLAGETSPYLLQHAKNPVDWYPWGEEARARARREQRLVFLSIGYSACHWCHVMERESFEDDEIARLLNEHFVSVKVDREERPDVDEIYMTAVQAMTGSGGWPLSVFLTPELEPFYGGTYFPPRDRWGRPGFATVLERVAETWEQGREQVRAQAGDLSALIGRLEGPPRAEPELDGALATRARELLRSSHDPSHGGFGGAPKFPPHFALDLLLRGLRQAASDEDEAMVARTLDGMARGGIYDQVGGGFSRYSTDAAWRVPHFEKMLYDNALLVPLYLEAGTRLGRPDDLRVARETLEWVLEDMTSPEGAFYSAMDADSEGVEGRYYVWTAAELNGLLDAQEAAAARAWWGVTEEGNWHEMPGVTVLQAPRDPDAVAAELGVSRAELEARVERARGKLRRARAERVPPATDTKVLTAWNGLMIRAMARGGATLREERFLAAARAAARFCLETMRGPEGLLRTWSAGEGGGRAHLRAYLEDHSHLAWGLLELFEATAEPEWLEAASSLADEMAESFYDPESGAFWFTAHDHEALITRPRAAMDAATPSGTSVATRVLLRLARWRERDDQEELARGVLRAMGGEMRSQPRAHLNLLVALEEALDEPVAVCVATPPGAPGDLLDAARRESPPGALVLGWDPEAPGAKRLEEQVPWTRGKTTSAGTARAWVCRAGRCLEPVVSAGDLRSALAAPA